MKRPAIFLDRDGTLNVDVDFTYRLEDLQLLAAVIPGLRQLQQLGFQLIITTNQSGIGRGIFTETQMHAFNAALLERLRSAGITIAAVYFCPFHSTAGLGEYRRDSPLRKPNPGMILAAAAEHDLDLAASFAIGDKPSDIAAGHAAGCRAILLRPNAVDVDETDPRAPPDFIAANLVEAAQYVARAVKTAD